MKAEEFLRILKEGVRAGDIIAVGKEGKGRFEEERLVHVFTEKGKHLLSLLIFLGRGHYRSWAEVYSVSSEFFGSELEGVFFDLLSNLADRLFVEYVGDRETVRELSAGVPPQLSRLGFELAKRGFSWQRDWYYPEGLREGNPKILAERPEDPSRRLKHLEDLKRDLHAFLKGVGDGDLGRRVEGRFKILQGLWKGA